MSEWDDYDWEADYKRSKRRSEAWGFLWWITVAYFVVEIFINVTVFRQLSLKSDFLTIESIAFWGKIITGVSAALVFTKTFYVVEGMFSRSSYKISSAKVFLLATLALIPVSFYLQNMLIEKMVDGSTADERNRAVLIINTQSTMKPHYQPATDKKPTVIDKLLSPVGSMKNSFIDGYIQKQNVWFSASSRCIEGASDLLGVTSNIDKAFFAYNALQVPLNEALYKDVITKYHSCVFKKPVYQRLMFPNPAFDDSKVRGFYDKYMDKSAEYAKARSEASQSQWGGFALDKVEERWNKGVSKLLGSDADIRPNLTYEEFVQNRDVQAYLKRQVKPENERMVPYSKWFVFELRQKMADASQELLPNTVIPTYISEGADKPLGMLIEYPDSYKGEKLDITDKQIEESGREAYKAIVMPIVVLGASLVFLLINLIILSSQIVVRSFFEGLGMLHPPIGTEIATSVLFALVVFGMPLHTINKEAESDPSITNVDKAVKFIYHYEKGLAFITLNGNNSIKYAAFKIGDIEGDVMNGEMDIPDHFK